MKTFLFVLLFVPNLASAMVPEIIDRDGKVDGVVQQYLLSPRGDIDGVLLKDGTTVRFAPHLRNRVSETIRPGDPVSIVPEHISATTSEGKGLQAYSIVNGNTGRSLTDSGPSDLPTQGVRSAQTELTVRGTVRRYLLNDRGDIDGLLLSGGEQVRFPPPVGNSLRPLSRKASLWGTVSASGPGVRNQYGIALEAKNLIFEGKIIRDRGRLLEQILVPEEGSRYEREVNH